MAFAKLDVVVCVDADGTNGSLTNGEMYTIESGDACTVKVFGVDGIFLNRRFSLSLPHEQPAVDDGYERLREIREYLQVGVEDEVEDAYDLAYRDALCDVLADCFGVAVSFKPTFSALPK